MVEANRDVLGKLLATSTKHERTIDFEKALEYPLTSVPLSLANADGTRRMTQKSTLMDVFVKKCSRDDMDFRTVLPARETVLAYIVDLMALIRTLTSVPETFEALALKVLDCIPKAYRRVDIVADCYTPHSIKFVERNRRGMAPKVKVQSPKSKLPRDVKVFLANGENKTRMIELIRDVLVSNREAILSYLGSECIVFSSFQDCIMVTRETVLQIPDLNSTQEEADTKVVLHANHVLTGNEEGVAIIRSHSGDIDIVVIALSHYVHDAERVILDSNTGRNRKTFKMSDIDLTLEQRRSLMGFHAFIGCDYNSAFFHRGKQVCWKLTEKKPKFVATFCRLGRTSTLEEDLSIELEEYV